MINPVGHYVLVEPIEVEAVTKGGIILPDQTVEKEQHAAQRGVIIAVGSASEYIKQEDVGRFAWFGRYAGIGATIEYEGRKFRLIDNTDIKALET